MNKNKSSEQASKTLSWLLRHGAVKEGLHIGADGYVRVSAILQHPRYASVFTLQQLQHIVASDKKKRYALRINATTGEHEICANQGHSMTAVQAEECLVRITDSAEVPMAVHGTYSRHWKQICAEGLRRMGRNHIHFAMSDVLQSPHQKGTTVISGFRADCQILIYLNVTKVIADGMDLFRSQNNVILCAGLSNGEIPVKYFEKVIDRRSGKLLSV